MFKLDSEVHAIPEVEEVLLPPAEVARRKKRRRIIILCSLIALVIVVLLAIQFTRSKLRQAAILAAGEDTRQESTDAAIAKLDGHDGVKARLLAAAALEGLTPLADAQKAFTAASDSDPQDKHIAQTYLALAKGDPSEASKHSNPLVPVGTYAAEIAYAKARNAWASGLPADAMNLAQAARDASPDAPRFVALWSLAASRSGKANDALAQLQSTTAESSAALLSAKSRIAFVVGKDEEARKAADLVLKKTDVTPAEKAWAHAISASVYARAGKLKDAIAAVEQALPLAPPGDESFSLQLADAAIRGGRPDIAEPLIRQLTSAHSTNGEARGVAIAELAIAQGLPETAKNTLGAMPASPLVSLSLGKVYQAIGSKEAARAAITSASTDERVRADALVALSELEQAEAQGAAAVSAIAPLLKEQPDHARFAPVGVAAHLAAEDVESALTLARAAAKKHPNEAAVIISKANAELAKQDYAAALVSLRHAATLAPNDASLHAKWGDAASEQKEVSEARSAYQKALSLDAKSIRASVGLMDLELSDGKIEAAASAYQTAQSAGATGNRIDILHSWYLVQSGAGFAGVSTVMRRMRRRRAPAIFRRLVAELYMQAERYNLATAMFDRHSTLGGDRVEAMLGKGLAYIRAERLKQANVSLEAARNALPDGKSIDEYPRTWVLRARTALFTGKRNDAEQHAKKALALKPDYGEALLVLADLKRLKRKDSRGELKSAAAAPYFPQPEAWARLARNLGSTPEGCKMARAYIGAAPKGDKASDSRDLVAECP